ncbi:hypothetical protein JL722_4113 [Aureococcus anophagefferens]|nr:hypothetical protein JL722_4113 [Aureococcus anophagefferens]
MDDDDGDGDDPTIIIDVSAWPRVSFARAEERLFEADGAPAASFDAAGARGEAAYAAAFRRAFAALGAAPEDASVAAAADAVATAARAACAAAALGDLRCRRAAAAGAAWCGLLGHCTQVEPQAVTAATTRGVAAALADVAPGCYKVAVRAAPPGAALRGAFWLDHFARRGAGGGYLAREAFDDLVAGPDGAAGLARRFVDY